MDSDNECFAFDEREADERAIETKRILEFCPRGEKCFRCAIG